ncbi:heme lyase CcmF/NrfE family subunit [Wenzhouxiangella sp. XN24]|uniref:heme lyase CcmF/NrfE family subunit n=1 Tax=Wenzhouxiangella sp. XN24 TaxID=2713569 RepID=UPI0013EBBD77|nr:heme lyase CcmF/NrfE family subunit [Wenzhouxiangella sp. XN24]NGX16562.1 heme lyase CcmF/NrfE family subunit [Wenzhouxiangella sp. XN24]
MIAELGHVALAMALCLAVAQGFFGLAGPIFNKPGWSAATKPVSIGHFVFVAISYAALTYSHVVNDFSVAYVAAQSNLALPVIYRIAGVWGGHEGSMLLWALMLAAWGGLLGVYTRRIPLPLASKVIGVMGIVSVGFLWFILATSNPFERLIPAPLDGRDLNPLLQDFGLVIHPPLLYMGYVGFAVAFSFAVAAMIEGKVEKDWARWVRPWTAAAWAFLTIGIALGSWWAYYELGWGGWWFWDPVENASFMPWLVGTALLHSLAVTERRGLFKGWSLLLAVSAFSLSLLGTFLVRSGVLVSVHAFATDPSRGMFILAMLVFFIGTALALYAWRAPQLAQKGGFDVLSRETFLLANNMLFVVATLLILLGTLYPLILDGLGLGKISVGPPYFNTVFIIPTLPLVLLMGLGMHSTWKKTNWSQLKGKLWPFALAAFLFALIVPLVVYKQFGLMKFIGVLLGVWVMAVAFIDPVKYLWKKKSLRGYSRTMISMAVAHFGVGLFVIGVTMVETYGIARDIGMRAGDTVTVEDYSFTFVGTRNVQGPNYSAIRGEVIVEKGGSEVTRLFPEKRTYLVQQNPMTEAAIHPRLHRDIFVAMGEPLGQGAWSMRIQYKPYIRLIWLGALVMAIGAFFGMTDKRYRVRREEEADERAEKPATGGKLQEGTA